MPLACLAFLCHRPITTDFHGDLFEGHESEQHLRRAGEGRWCTALRASGGNCAGFSPPVIFATILAVRYSCRGTAHRGVRAVL